MRAILLTQERDSYRPILSKNLYVQEFSKYIYEGLFTQQKDQFAYPTLCDEWQISPNGLTWTFHIRQNVMCHDNIPLSSEDIQFTFDTIFNPQSNSIYKSNVQNISSYAAVDRNNFKVILKKPDSFMLEKMTFPIISKHTFEGENVLNSPRNMKPVGTGPYKFNSNDGAVIRLGTNDVWWKKTVEKNDNPLITELDIKIFKNAAENLSALQAKNVDVAFADALSSSRYNGNYNISIKKYPTKSFDYTAFNMYRPVTADKSVRQAIAFALDRKKIIEKVLPGGATVSDLPLLPDSWLFNSNPVYFNVSFSNALF
jgi:peptide/nickel transport system substrate-binding protein